MNTPITPATNISVQENGEYSATVNGTHHSGICEGGSEWKNVQKAIENGVVPEPYVKHVDTYTESRLKEYPDIGDQLDAIWKQFRTMELTPETKIVADEIQAVKDRWPKSIELLAK